MYDTPTSREEAGLGGASQGVWQGGVDVHETEPIPRNEFQEELEREERREPATQEQVLHLQFQV